MPVCTILDVAALGSEGWLCISKSRLESMIIAAPRMSMGVPMSFKGMSCVKGSTESGQTKCKARPTSNVAPKITCAVFQWLWWAASNFIKPYPQYLTKKVGYYFIKSTFLKPNLWMVEGNLRRDGLWDQKVLPRSVFYPYCGNQTERGWDVKGFVFCRQHQGCRPPCLFLERQWMKRLLCAFLVLLSWSFPVLLWRG